MEPIAIIGFGCRFPAAASPEAYWELLRQGVDAIGEIPRDRWKIAAFYDEDPDAPGKMCTRWGGFLEDVARFDAEFFGITPREAERIDPQQRLVLEVAWEALEDAGIAPDQLAGSRTGVFVGISHCDYDRIISRDLARLNIYNGAGSYTAIAANRVSYVLRLRGPSMTIDTACSSSLTAVHIACQSLLGGETSLALAGGVNLILTPHESIAISKARMFAADGRCKTFDAAADGYVRGEGCGMVVLKRLPDALRDGDTVRAVIRGSAVNQNGLSNGLMAPSGSAQQEVIRLALANAAIEPLRISYFEAHGIGTALGDSIEAKAIAAVLAPGRSPSQPCFIGSAKTNFGHLEAAAGVAGLIKVVLCLQHREIVPHLHLRQLGPHVALDPTLFPIPTTCRSWPNETGRRLAGVSSFGFGGSNCHVILEEAEAPVRVAAAPERPVHLLTLAAKSEQALRALAQRYASYLAAAPATSLADTCFTANTGRSKFDYRLAALAETAVALREQLDQYGTAGHAVGIASGRVIGRKPPKVAFLFPGLASQQLAVGRQVYQTQPTFRRALDRCSALLGRYLPRPLLPIFDPPPGEGSPPDQAAAECALFALEFALAALWRSWGVEPTAILGQGPGECVAACVVGQFCLEEGLKLLALRAHDAQGPPRDATVAAVYGPKPPNGAQPLCARLPLADGVRYLREQKCEVFLELGPGETLLAPGSQCLPEQTELWLPSFREGQDEWRQLLETVGSLHVRGVKVDWLAFDRDYPRRKLPLPTYPFQGQRHWFEPSEFLPPQSGVSSP